MAAVPPVNVNVCVVAAETGNVVLVDWLTDFVVGGGWDVELVVEPRVDRLVVAEPDGATDVEVADGDEVVDVGPALEEGEANSAAEGGSTTW